MEPAARHFLGMLVYAMVQELATGLNYRNLRRRVMECGGDPALSKLLMYVSVDEQAHYGFFRDCVRLYLKYDTAGTLEAMRRVMNNFAMPAINDFADGRQRVARIKALDIFSEDIYYREVYLPILASLDVSRKEMSPSTEPQERGRSGCSVTLVSRDARAERVRVTRSACALRLTDFKRPKNSPIDSPTSETSSQSTCGARP